MNPIDLFSFKGRMRRKHFALALFITVALIFAINAGWQMTHIKAIILSRYLVIAAFLPSCARRLQDIGLIGWWVVAVFVMPLFVLPLLILPSMPFPNRYGPSPKPEVPDDLPEES